jgi:hypothetical protein
MAQSLRQEFSHEMADMVLDDIQYRRSRYYYFLGGVEPWNGLGGAPADDVAPTDPFNEPDDPTVLQIEQSDRINRKYRSEIAFVRQISPNEVSMGVRKVNWRSGDVYDQWDHTQDMRAQNFYALTEDFNVYKCLDNAGGSPSTFKPSSTSIYPFRTPDGYLWKYLYNIPVYKRTRFTSTQYMPVQRALSNNFYNRGAIDAVVVDSPGEGYSDVQLTFVSVSTNTLTGGGAVASVVLDYGTFSGVGTITAINIISGGSGYTAGVAVKIVGSGFGAKVKAIVSGGIVTGVEIIDGGIGYNGATTVQFTTGGAQIIPIMSRTTGSIVSVKIIDGGIGYGTSPTLTVSSATSSGTGAYGNATALLQAVVHQGVIKHVNIIDPGKDYPVDNATTITVQGDGDDAVFTPAIHGGKLVGVVVETPGSNYSYANITVQSATGVGAVVRGVITESDLISDQMVIEQTAVKGAIYNVKVTNPGRNYTPQTSVTVTGNGTGCVVEPVIESGQIVRMHVVTPGVGYTYAIVTITDVGRPIVPDNEAASAYVILPPNAGHGANAPVELYADTLVVNTPLRDELEVEGIVQEYRNFGIIKNPSMLSTNARYIAPSEVLVYKVVFASASGVIKDELLSLGDNRFRVLEVMDNTVQLIPIDRDNVAPTGLLTSADGRQYQSVSVLKSLEFDKYSGTMIYVSTENPFMFTSDQSITIRTFLKF